MKPGITSIADDGFMLSGSGVFFMHGESGGAQRRSYMKRYFKENNITISMAEEDMAELKKGCVDFYSFSYYSTINEQI